MDYYGDRLGDWLVNETFMPVQYADQRRPSDMAGEMWLLWALIVDAIDCYLMPQLTTRATRLHAEADAWIRGEGHPQLAFTDVCNWLNLEAEAVRERLLTGMVRRTTKRSVRSGQRKDRKITANQRQL
jgi:hypothetical protein